MPAEQTTKWTREQLTVTLDLYCRTPFGRLHRGNPDAAQIHPFPDRQRPGTAGLV